MTSGGYFMTLFKTFVISLPFLVIFSIKPALAIEEAKYDLVSEHGDIEVRLYSPHIVAETVVYEDIEEAGNAAFQRLFGYITGSNTSQADIAMTAPVSQQPSNEEIAMTAPVGQQQSGDGWAISFMMPNTYTIETLPVPEDDRVVLRQVPSQTIAAIRYSGFWSESNYLEHKAELENWIEQSGYKINDQAIWARYNAPFTPWFLRRNEVLIPIL